MKILLLKAFQKTITFNLFTLWITRVRDLRNVRWHFCSEPYSYQAF